MRMGGILPHSSAFGYRRHAPGALISLQSGILFTGNANCITRAAAREGLDEVGQREDADASQAELRRHFLHGRLRSLSAFLAIERERDAHRFRAGGADDVHGLADRGSGGIRSMILRCPTEEAAAVVELRCGGIRHFEHIPEG